MQMAMQSSVIMETVHASNLNQLHVHDEDQQGNISYWHHPPHSNCQ